MRLKVEGDESLVRDTNTNAILQTDIAALHRHRAMRQTLQEKDQKLEDLIDRINKLEQIIERMTDANHIA